MHGGIERGRTLRGNKFNQTSDLLIRHEHALCANEPRSARRQIKHVALAEQPVGAVFIQNHAAVDLRSDLKRNPARNVRLDHPGDDVGARRLRCNNKMNAGRARHLCDPGDGALHVGRRRLH